jgi:Family of unknown function (DUF6174)
MPPAHAATVPRRDSRRWIWFFAVLVVLTIAGITIQVVYNARQQLKQEELDRALALWKEKGPRDYDLKYTTRKDGDAETFEVRVRGGQVVAVTLNGRPLEPWQYHYHSMPALFDYVAAFLKQDTEPGRRRTFATAQFDAADGHLIHYVRSVMGTRERVEINTQLTPVPEQRSAADGSLP